MSDAVAPDSESYAYLWNGSQAGWVLLRAPELEAGYCIFNISNGALLHIDDESLNTALCRAMATAGCLKINDLPDNLPGASVFPA